MKHYEIVQFYVVLAIGSLGAVGVATQLVDFFPHETPGLSGRQVRFWQFTVILLGFLNFEFWIAYFFRGPAFHLLFDE